MARFRYFVPHVVWVAPAVLVLLRSHANVNLVAAWNCYCYTLIVLQPSTLKRNGGRVCQGHFWIYFTTRYNVRRKEYVIT